jgi:nucleolar protein 53
MWFVHSRNRVRTKEERKHFIAKSKAEQRLKEGIVPYRIRQAHEQRLQDQETKEKQKVEKKPQFNKDLWEVEDHVVPDKFKVHWITPELVKYHMYNRGKPMMKTPQITHEKRSQLKAVVAPHPGVSYNPSVADHYTLLDKVVEKEKAHIKEEKHLDRVTTKLFTKMTPAEREALDRKELVQGFPIPENTDTESDGEDSGEDYQAVNPPARNKKKDRKTRNKEKTAREKKKLEQLANRQVRKIVDINRVPEFQSEIKKTDAERKASHDRYKAIRAAQKFGARRIGKMAYEEPEVDFVSGDQLAGNLRNLQPAGSILVDRFKSMQKRNILVPNAKRKAPKSRVKHTTKRSHRHEEDYGIGQVEGHPSQIKKAKV